jgi:hypothetical protein
MPSSKSQISITNDQNNFIPAPIAFGILEIGNWDLFGPALRGIGAWRLVLVLSLGFGPWSSVLA